MISWLLTVYKKEGKIGVTFFLHTKLINTTINYLYFELFCYSEYCNHKQLMNLICLKTIFSNINFGRIINFQKQMVLESFDLFIALTIMCKNFFNLENPSIVHTNLLLLCKILGKLKQATKVILYVFLDHLPMLASTYE